jgi:Tfp pilus assembly major pilin PilA
MEAGSAQDAEALYRAAVGSKKADFYVPQFIRFDQAGASKLSWNWPAFFVSFYWFLYRRMYGTWGIYSLLIPLGIGGVSVTLASSLGAGVGDWFYLIVTLGYRFGVIPLLANLLYHDAIRKRLEVLRRKVPETSSQLLVLENTSPTNNIIWLIIPFMGIAVLGILAAIAIPAYQTYTIRAQISEGFILTNQIKSAVVKNYLTNKSWPVSIQELSLSQPMSGRYVSALAVDRGTISVTFGNQANALIAGHVLSFRPSLSDTGAILWTCGYAAAVGREDPANPAAPGLTNIKPQFLPGTCR